MVQVFDNVVESADLKQRLIKAFESLASILVAHCGPFATSCVIGSRFRQTNDVDEFTKDGIKILRHLIVSDNPEDRFAARMARFVGIAVDKRCHDGTTTSMLLFCRIAILAVQKMDGDLFSNEQYRWAHNLTQGLEMCLKLIEDLKITEDDILQRATEFGIATTIEDVRAAMAYHMAMISSKGDGDLSAKVASVIKSSPKKIYGMFRDVPLAVETEEAYILKKQEHDLLINANIGNINDYNYKNDTQYLSENAVIFASGNEIVINGMESIFLNAFISQDKKRRPDLAQFGDIDGWEAYHGGKRNLIILSPLLNDPELIANINTFNKENPSIRISWFNVQVHPRMRTNLNKTIHFMAGASLFTDVMDDNPLLSFVGLEGPPVRVHLLGYLLSLSNLYEKDGEVFHPLYRNPDAFEPYTRFCRETEDMIEFANQHISNPALDHDELTYLISLYRALTCQEIYDIEVGGSAHDQYANRTVYEDTIGAALSAVNEGVILGGYAHLYVRCQELGSDQWNPSSLLNLADIMHSVVMDSMHLRDGNMQLDDLLAGSAEGLDTKWSYIAADQADALRSDTYVHRYCLDKDMMEAFLSMTPGKTILLQAFGGYHEQFKRFKDILPRLANTNSLADMRRQDGDDVR